MNCPMLLIGERLNTSRPGITEVVRARDESFVRNEAIAQYKAGVQAIDVNAAMLLDNEPEGLAWLVEVVQEAVPADICIDTPNPQALKVALERCKRPVIINSISSEGNRYNEIVPLVREFKARVIALPANEAGIGGRAEDRYTEAMNLLERLDRDGINLANVYLDPLVYPVSVAPDSAVIALKTVELLKEAGVSCHFVVGLSNVSFGLPFRKRVNEAFLIMCMGKGVDAFILDPLDDVLMQLFEACRVLTMDDPGGLQYIASARKRKKT
ncbi:MAG: dihydropteroate synthase [Syntrophothermus sp.]|uniref:dihydropteroate synthase n=1 Tax=Syntrophothermus sp. TaxID=2736299 RepID=UPI00257EF75D|nr:dihydropteroate synthase [Syntrophothermus sp.]NSW84141.1 dihydropteroate synthase [Syntrophothermus sp.]